MKEVFARLRKYEIRIRKAVVSQMRGDYHSVFKGSGLEFNDVRAYQYGDDVRTIDWNVSAKGHGMFVKLFREEKEQTVFFLVDVSASQDIGRKNRKKMDMGREIAGVLILSAIQDANHVGMICYSSQKEAYVPPAKGIKHGYGLISTLYRLQPLSPRTDLNKAMAYAFDRIKRRSVIIILSDFVDHNYAPSLKALAHRHDVVVIHLADERERRLPNLGIVPVYDPERRRTQWVNTASAEFQQQFSHNFALTQTGLQKLCQRYGASFTTISTDEDFVPKLIKLFNVRNAR